MYVFLVLSLKRLTFYNQQTPNEIWREYLRRLKMSSAPSLAAYSYDGTWFLAKGLDNIVKSHGMKLENITTGNETFYDLLLRSLSSVTFTGLTVSTYNGFSNALFQ